MASSVFFKFKSQKEPTRVAFDGTGISVFELKREIILRAGLGDGTDFDLAIYADENGKEVYDDDTSIIPRSTTVIARRMPPKNPGRGGAARYVSGKMPIHAKNSSRREQTAKPAAKTQSNTLAQLSSAMTEEEKMAAVFQAQTEHFTSREEEMATQQYVAKGGPKKPANVPDHDPPQGYICYRCGEKGHWIQLCPTNDNPDYDNRPRVKRTTGIPKSFLKTVDKATALGQNADGDDGKTPSGIMVNADGEFVIAEPDKVSWERFQAKAKSNNAASKAATEGEKEVQERGLECSIDKKMFIEPMKTPCCSKTYCNDCITNALIESDFVCPACNAEGVLIDDLKTDEEAVETINQLLADRDSKAKEGSKSPKSPSEVSAKSPQLTATEPANKKKSASPSPAPANLAPPPQQTSQQQTATPNPSIRSATSTPINSEPSQQTSKKRPAEDALENPKIPKAPKAMQPAQQSQQHKPPINPMMNSNNMMSGMNPMAGGMMPGMNMSGMPPMMFPGMNPMNMNMMGNFGGMPGNFGGPGGMPNMNMNGMNMMNPMMPMMNPMMNGFQGMPNNNNNNNHNFNPRHNNWGGGPNGGFQGHQQHNQHPPQQQMPPQGMMGMGMGGPGMGLNGMKSFSHQPADDEDAYFRKPVNPHRHQNRQKRVRPSDYREL